MTIKKLEQIKDKLKMRNSLLRRIMVVSAAIILLLVFMIVGLFRLFEKMTYQAIADNNLEFVREIDNRTETINDFVATYGQQLYYSPSVTGLMSNRFFINDTETSYGIRYLNAMANTSDFVDDIYVLNDITQQVYSTDPYNTNVGVLEIQDNSIRELLSRRSKNERFIPILINRQDLGKEQYAFKFYEVQKDGFPKPGIVLVCVNSSWYRNMLLSNTTSSQTLILNDSGDVLLSTSAEATERYNANVRKANVIMNNGFSVNNSRGEIYYYYSSQKTGFSYLRIASIADTVPEMMSIRRSVFNVIGALILVFAVLSITLILYALLPMLKMKKAIHQIHQYQENTTPTEQPVKLDEQLESVVTLSQRNNDQHLFYDMLMGSREPDEDKLFVNETKQSTDKIYRLILIPKGHRNEIYDLCIRSHPEIVVTKASNVNAAVGLFETEEAAVSTAKELSNELGCRCYISSAFRSFPTVQEHFQNLLELLRLSLTLDKTMNIVFEDMLGERRSELPFTQKEFTAFHVLLKSGNYKSICEKWNELSAGMAECRYEIMQYTYSRLRNMMMSVISEHGSKVVKERLPQRIEQYDSFEKLNDDFRSLFEIVSQRSSVERAEKYSQLSMDIQKYIEENLSNESLSVQEISERVNMNTAYLGRLFKQTYGESIIQYITRLRVERAKQYLTETDEKVEDIAGKVGISNNKYFYVVFKKIEGVTPTEYRKQYQNKS